MWSWLLCRNGFLWTSLRLFGFFSPLSLFFFLSLLIFSMLGKGRISLVCACHDWSVQSVFFLPCVFCSREPLDMLACWTHSLKLSEALLSLSPSPCPIKSWSGPAVMIKEWPCSSLLSWLNYHPCPNLLKSVFLQKFQWFEGGWKSEKPRITRCCYFKIVNGKRVWQEIQK